MLVKVHPEGKYVVDIDKDIDIAELTPGGCVWGGGGVGMGRGDRGAVPHCYRHQHQHQGCVCVVWVGGWLKGAGRVGVVT